MGNAKPPVDLSWRLARKTSLGYGLLLMFWITGCGGKTTANTATPPPSPQTYFAPYVVNTDNGGAPLLGPATYTISDTAGTFSQTTYQLSAKQLGPQVINAGVLSVAGNGLRSLGITANYVVNNGTPPQYNAVTYSPPKAGSFAVELADQAGGLVQLVGQPVAPLVAATQCPNFATPKTYQFVTIPAALASLGTPPIQYTWDPAAETAYGSVDISSSGSTVTFQNIHQYTLPSSGGSGTPAHPAPSSAAGACGPTFFGNITHIPGQLVVTDPGGIVPIPPQASIGIDSTGDLMVEDNGTWGTNPRVSGPIPALLYENTLGAGTGAVGISKPASALDTSAVAGAQYLGFIYGAGTYNVSTPANWFSHVASFGFSNVPSSCASVAPSSSTLIYGGDFPNDDPSGSGNCDFAIDLGTQDAANNGLYPHATVWVGASYAANPSGATYSFPAVAIAGQIKGKYAIFLIGADYTQPWAIYLLQSN